MVEMANMANILHKIRVIGATTLLLLPVSGYGAPGDLADEPLFLGGGDVPGNMVLTPSVEYPTINSVANIAGPYSSSDEFVGYFDPDKCYTYRVGSVDQSGVDLDASDNRFEPTSTTSDRRCSGDAEWSGNYLNWATTQTIDPFRKVLTGGYRYKDTTTETWLEKARHSGEGGTNLFPDRTVSDATEVQGATPFTSRIETRISGMGVKMRFRLDAGNMGSSSTPFSPQGDTVDATKWVSGSYDLEVRVEVCVDDNGGTLLESNCKEYDSAWKPEGLIQENADNIRFSVFGYLNDSSVYRDGGVLRARQKFVGEREYTQSAGYTTNASPEWDLSTGVLYQNPDSSDASATSSTIQNSGVINYLNKFGQLNSGNHKSIDPVSELYYAATRYLKNQGNVPEYSSVSHGTASEKVQWRDNFPVIESWNDPMQFECQANVILGIGDANTHRDKNLPGNTSYLSEEPSKPSEVSSDSTVDVIARTNRVGELENLGNIANTNSFSGRNNSAYIAGLAFDNHTTDIRSDLDGDQYVSTYWVDVLEEQVLEPVASNQYFLATKYGGFDKPDGFDPDSFSGTFEESWWHTNGETLYPNTGGSFEKPDNYYVAGNAAQMIASLNDAFDAAGSDIKGTSASVSFNSTTLETDSLLFGARFDAGDWSGEFFARELIQNAQGAPSVATTDLWEAGTILDARDLSTDPRQIITYSGSSGVAFTESEFTASTLSSNQIADLSAGGVTVDTAEDRLAHIRGESITGMRARGSRLGDVVNSSPVYVGKPALNWPNGSPFGATSYATFKNDKASRDPVVYVGANDGMLHAFSAEQSVASGGGKELFAYIPEFLSSAQSDEGLHYLTDPDYSHRYYVDLTPNISDVSIGGPGGAAEAWRTVLVGGARSGGRGLFALDVTNPSSFSEANASDMALWEFTPDDDNRLGYLTDPPSVVMAKWGSNDFRWTVIFGNGYNSGSGSSGVFLLDMEGGLDGTWTSGSDYQYIELEGSTADGLSTITAVDLNGDMITDRVYGGDLNGRLWVAEAASNGTWGSVYKQGNTPEPLFIAERAGNPQPITVAPAIVRSPQPGNAPNLLVMFGTGQYLTSSDPNNTDVQSYYGITDRGVDSLTRTSLLERTLSESTVTIGGITYQVRESAGDTWGTEKGWYVDFVTESGERIAQPTQIRGDYAFVNSIIPSQDPCAAGGDGWIMAFGLDGRTPDRPVLAGFPNPVVGYKVKALPNKSGFIGDYMITPLSDNTFKEDELDLGPSEAAGRVSWQEIY